MNKLDLKIGDIVYWNTTGAYNSNISLKAEVIDKGEKYIWIIVFGNLGPTPVNVSNLSETPLYDVTNNMLNK